MVIDLAPIAKQLGVPVSLYGNYITPPEALLFAQSAWVDLVRVTAKGLLMSWSRARMELLVRQRDYAMAAAELGEVPPPELEQATASIASLRDAYQQWISQLDGCREIQQINAILVEAAAEFGVDFEPYPEKCPWRAAD